MEKTDLMHAGASTLLAEGVGERPATTSQLEQQIRFALSDLGARNGHHIFEDVCRHFAQHRFASNILPATGPVSAGGDQGRDIETFHSYLRRELGPHGAFLGLVSDGLVVFIATIQKDDVDKKILADVKTILAGGRRPATIYALCTGDLNVAKRHKLEKYIAKQFEGTFEIINRDALATHLAAPDLFWVAEQYLHLPAALAPQRPADEAPLPEWYVADRERWRERVSAQPTLGDVLDLKDGLRHATRFAEARPDLPFWLSLARGVASDEAPRRVRHRARYEVAWATIQALRDGRPADDLVRRLVQDVLSSEELEPVSVEDAAILLTSWTAALRAGRTDLAPAEIRSWNGGLRDRLRDELARDPRPTRRAELLDLLGYLALQQDSLKIEPPSEELELPDVLDMIDEFGDMKPVLRDAAGWPHPIDLDETMAAWGELTKLFGSAQLFPVVRFSKRLAFMTPLLVDEPGWRELIDTVDAAVRKTSGSAAVAEAARDRGLALLKAGRYRSALHEMHTAKVEWWSGDTLRGSLLAMMLIADCYRELRLPQAAKQHALAVAYAAAGKEDVLDLVPAGLLAASEIDYQAGSWCSALELCRLGLMAQAHYVDTEADAVASDQRERALFTVGWCLLMARGVAPKFVPYVEQVAKKGGMLDALNDVTADAPANDRETVLGLIDDQLLGRALNDSGTRRVIRFAALGVDCTITSSNRFADARAAERFAAALQITLVEMGEDDLCLLPTSVRVRVELADDGEPADQRVRWAPSNRGRDWLVRLTPYDPSTALDPDAVSLELMLAITQILLDASLLPDKQYFAAVEKAYRRGLTHKLSSVRPYDELGVPRDVYNRTPRAHVHPPADPVEFRAREHDQLAWRNDPGPTYDREEALRLIRERYSRSSELIPRTLARLGADQPFSERVAEVCRRGWRDWHVLQAIVNAALNDKLRREGLGTYGQRDDADRRTRELLKSGDLEEDPEQPIELTLDELDFHRRGAIPMMIDAWDLEMHQDTPDLDAIDRFLGARYGYWTDDVEHEDPFPLATAIAEKDRT